MKIGERIKLIRGHYCKGSNEAFANAVGEKPNTVSNWVNRNPGNISVIEKILTAYPDVNVDWLITGEGEMLKSNKSVSVFLPENLPKQVGKLYLAPIYESYPVSAGNMGLSAVRDDKPDGYAYTTMPGVVFFPVVGCSFEPIIKAGHYIGTVKVDSWDRVDTEKIYFILTREERMIKRLRVDNNDNNILWCVSPNFQEFKIMKQDVIEISHVFFYGMMV